MSPEYQAPKLVAYHNTKGVTLYAGGRRVTQLTGYSASIDGIKTYASGWYSSSKVNKGVKHVFSEALRKNDYRMKND